MKITSAKISGICGKQKRAPADYAEERRNIQ
jgi:hypothetical protein